MDKLITFFKQVDKQEHFMGCALVVFMLQEVVPLWAACVAVVTLAAWKEWVYDKARPANHTVDPLDFAAGVLGVVLAAGWILGVPIARTLLTSVQ